MLGLDTIQIYKVLCHTTKKLYIGQTSMSIKERWRHHRRRSGEIENGLSDAILEYGEENFTIEVLAMCEDPAAANLLETYFIEKFQSLTPDGFNRATGPGTTRRELHRDNLAKARTNLTKIPTELLKRPKNEPTKEGRKRAALARYKPVIGVHSVTGEEIELEGMSVDVRFDPRLISACCLGKRRYHRGYSWRFK